MLNEYRLRKVLQITSLRFSQNHSETYLFFKKSGIWMSRSCTLLVGVRIVPVVVDAGRVGCAGVDVTGGTRWNVEDPAGFSLRTKLKS